MYIPAMRTKNRTRSSQSLFTRFIKKILLIGIVIFFTTLLWGMRSFFSPTFLTETHLILFTNESEARPCGGFVTAYGELSFLPPRFFLKNIYDLRDLSFGPADYPLDQVSPDIKFWDLGTEIGLESCTNRFAKAYRRTERDIDRVWLIDMQTIENVLAVLGSVSVHDATGTKTTLTADNFFATVSRSVANVDRHDEQTLETRKSLLSQVGKKMLTKAIFSPWQWHQILSVVSQSAHTGRIFISDFSSDIAPNEQDLVVTEWNLGGGKTSPALQKQLHLTLREVSPQDWKGTVNLTARNLQGYDEPLGQYWQGGFQFRFPVDWNLREEFVSAKIAPGEVFRTDFEFDVAGEMETLSVFVPRGQSLFAGINVTLFPQQSMRSSVLTVESNHGSFWEVIGDGRTTLEWENTPDAQSPFLTFHQRVGTDSLAEELQDVFADNPFLVEVHVNERVKLDENFSATLIDRDYTNKSINENLTLRTHYLAEDGVTLLLDFAQDQPQPSERFYLELQGMRDWWGNAFANRKNTVIER